ncbi:uncharacterized protein LOC108108876 [Drosophila eugracilis]|uniref:uncharacterized protein LOC108108876 n=1 Tax=Drosophila eugracilis TaxID=29029 RepID=UPI0007E677FE|nr:uncharacterized protein LOC108108876 [Drosophila eugracilis]
MCTGKSQKVCCVLMALGTICLGILEISYSGHKLIFIRFSTWLTAWVVSWLPIIFASLFLIVGALQEIRWMLVTWIVVSLTCGVAMIIIRLGYLINDHRHNISGDIVLCLTNVIYLFLVFVWAAYPYAYMQELQQETPA